jgi:hypothetical protein
MIVTFTRVKTSSKAKDTPDRLGIEYRTAPVSKKKKPVRLDAQAGTGSETMKSRGERVWMYA